MATALDASSRSSAYRLISIESESSSTTGRISQKGSPRPTNRCANSWRNSTARATEGLDGGEAHETFEMATSCERQCIIDEELWVINEERIDSKEPCLMDPEIAFASHCRSYGLGESHRHSNSSSITYSYILPTPSFFISKVHKHTRIQ